jgi:hypothetical protein
MAANRNDLHFLAIRMQVGAIRAQLPGLGLCEPAAQVVGEVLNRIDAQVREWQLDGMVVQAQLQELLVLLMRVPGDLRELKEAGKDGELTIEIFEALGIVAPRDPGPGPGTVS